jgi:hypothetical protein
MAVVAVLGMGWMGLGAYWFLRLMGALGAGGFKRVISDGMWWAFPPAVVVLTIFLVLANAPLRLRFELSQGSLERYARESIAEPNVTHPARLGLYRIRKVQRFDGGVRLLTSECMSDLCGFAYSPEGEPPKGRGENHFVHLEGPWYLWEQSW